mgnify:CR=1 FL=1
MRPISSVLGSYAGSGLVGTWVGDRLGIPGAVSITRWWSGIGGTWSASAVAGTGCLPSSDAGVQGLRWKSVV